MNEPKPTKAREFVGNVVSTKTAKTIVVEVKRLVKHPKYGKFLLRSKRYQVHVPAGQFALGDTVRIKESRPYSRHKHFVVVGKIL